MEDSTIVNRSTIEDINHHSSSSKRGTDSGRAPEVRVLPQRVRQRPGILRSARQKVTVWMLRMTARGCPRGRLRRRAQLFKVCQTARKGARRMLGKMTFGMPLQGKLRQQRHGRYHGRVRHGRTQLRRVRERRLEQGSGGCTRAKGGAKGYCWSTRWAMKRSRAQGGWHETIRRRGRPGLTVAPDGLHHLCHAPPYLQCTRGRRHGEVRLNEV